MRLLHSSLCFLFPESFTADHKPLMGEAPEVRGFFLGCGFNSAGKFCTDGKIEERTGEGEFYRKTRKEREMNEEDVDVPDEWCISLTVVRVFFIIFFSLRTS